MASARMPFVGGNWKMNTDRAGARALAHEIVNQLGPGTLDNVDVAVFPPFPYLITVTMELQHHGSRIRLGAQDVYDKPDGAFTGEVSTRMLRDCGAALAITGHSERRHVIGENDDLVNRKTRAALDNDLDCILCIGETIEQREAGRTDEVNERQLRAALAGVGAEQMTRVTIAYEPVWAIGTGNTATSDDAQMAHERIRDVLAALYDDRTASQTRIQYGGSVKPANAAELIARPDVDGFLVGGASLKAEDFVPIVLAAAGVGAPG